MAKIVVVGSINMDLVTESARFADVGETILGQDFQTFFGGKGANQAIAASRLGAEVTMIGAVGADDFGRLMLQNLQQEGVCTDAVKMMEGCRSGIASIVVSQGQNQIIVVSGANALVTPEDIDAQEIRIAGADVVLAQLETPLETVIRAAELAGRHHVPFILNPAPAQPLPESLLKRVTVLTPNESELYTTLCREKNIPVEQVLAESSCAVVLTQGAKGAAFFSPGAQAGYQSAFDAEVVDSTGAGDTFNAALAEYLSAGLAEAVKYACAAGALSVMKMGAQAGMPTREELTLFLHQ